MTHADCPNLAFLIWWNTAREYERMEDMGIGLHTASTYDDCGHAALLNYLEFWRLHTEAGGQ